MEIINVEYLIVIEKNSPFCNNAKSLTNLIEGINKISITNNTIRYESIKIEFNIKNGTIQETNERFFHLILNYKEKEKIDDFNKALHSIKKGLNKIEGINIQILWDDIGLYYAQKAYPLIYNIENKMRKLITKFMSTNIGSGWSKKNIPEKVKNSIKNKNKEDTNEYLYNDLYQIDFIQLAIFLFTEYKSEINQNIIKKIKNTNNIENLDIEEIKKLVPHSNWERYFHKIIDYEEKSLKEKWEELYELRNKIAHNKHIFRTYAKVTSLRHYERQRRNRKNPVIASLHFVSVAMTNLRCVSPDIKRRI